jgi:hypothetical protein
VLLPRVAWHEANPSGAPQISDKRRVTLSEFRGKAMISIREYYEKGGKQLPGKKVTSPGASTRSAEAHAMCSRASP